ncbi:MAG TPA: outer membrane beta-barrel domain-containing protein [Archangium sp.]|uniref:outer membrane beta-barrel domain-containing protein n=1 Tax=Archangium sp. TaxID=1872627 RepID=UPI002E2F505D|nr:outer membrane beta-barrel domain-containing protein [Archangium sp.]HEX5751393.1 outer membrane beta-barrel domain-containing protein [Archangium sp.]
MKTATRLLIALCLAPVPALAQDAAPAPAPAAPARPAPSASGSSEQEAGDVSEVDKDRLGPLRERVRPVSGHLFLKQGRFEFSPSATLSIKDAFFSKYILGGTLTYHPSETLGLSLRAGYALNTVASAAQICTFTGDDGSTRGCRRPTYEELDGEAPGQLTLMGGVDVQWAPIYGKISLLAEQFLHFDLYGVVGATAVQYRGPAKTAELTGGGNVGVGMRFFLNRWVTVRTEFRDLIYVEKALNPATTLRNQLMFELGVSLFFPSAHPEP